MSVKKECCKCIFFKGERKEPDQPGSCRINPPVVTNQDGFAIFPSIKGSDFCFKFQEWTDTKIKIDSVPIWRNKENGTIVQAILAFERFPVSLQFKYGNDYGTIDIDLESATGYYNLYQFLNPFKESKFISYQMPTLGGLPPNNLNRPYQFLGKPSSLSRHNVFLVHELATNELGVIDHLDFLT